MGQSAWGRLIAIGILTWSVGCDGEADVLGSTDGGEPEDAPMVDAPGDAAPADGGPQPMRWTLDDVRERYCEPLTEVICDAYARCGCFGTVEVCELGELTDRCAMDFEEAARSDHDYWDGARILARLADHRSHYDTCTTPPLRPWPMAYIAHVSTLALDEPCEASPGTTLCAEGRGVCDDGACRALPRAGETCVAARGGTLPCTPPARCVQYRCIEPGGPGASCTEDAACVAPARCIDSVCTTLGDDGDACTESTQCLPLHNCTGGRCEAATTCTPGEACGYGSGCDDGTCICELHLPGP